MKILFSNPPWWSRGEKGEIRAGVRAGSRWPFTMQTNSRPDAPAYGEYCPFPFFLGYAASFAQAALPEATVVLRDSLARREAYGTFLDYVASFQPDFVVVETATPSWEHDSHMIAAILSAHEKAKIIVTGTITTTRHAEIVALGHAAVLGEYEKGVVRAIKGEWGMIPHDFLSTQEMNAAPPPMFDERYALAYWDGCPSGQQMPHLQIWTNRGCSFKCCFCSQPAVMTNNDPDGTGRRAVRFYTPKYVEAMIAARLEKNPSIACIYNDDDIFNYGDKHTLAISGVLKSFKLPWSAMCRADTIKLSTWDAMLDAGCFGVKIGIESGSQHVLDKIVNKNLSLHEVENVVLPHLKSIGLKVHTTWTIGLPGETYEQANDTLRMIERLYEKGLHHTHQLSGTATIEGTPLDTLVRKAEVLKAYPGATREGFIVSGDGQAKIEQMMRALPPPQ